MSQHDFTVDNASGATVRGDINNALQALASLSAGASAPSPTFPNQLWVDTTNSLLKKRNNANAAWVTIGAMDAANFGLLALSGGALTGALSTAKGAGVASAATTDIWVGADGNLVHVTGSTGPITSFGTAPQAGAWRIVIFDSTPTITDNSAIVTGRGANVVVVANTPYLVVADTTSKVYFVKAPSADAVQKKTISIPGSAWVPRTTTGSASSQSESGTNKVNRKTADFVDGSQTFAQCTIPLPKNYNGGTITYRMFFESSVGSNNMVFGLQALFLRNGDTIDTAFGTAVTTTNACGASTVLNIGSESSAVTPGGTYAANCELVLQLYRDGAAGGDTNTGTGKVWGVEVFYNTSALDDA